MSGADHERIWLQSPADCDPDTGRLWCQDKVWPNEHDEHEPTEYVRADQLAAAVQAERAACEREASDLADGLSDNGKHGHAAGAERVRLAIRARGDTSALDAALAAARIEGMEAAAKWHDEDAKKAGTWRDWGGPSDKTLQAKEAFHIEAAASIRARIEKGEGA